MDFAVAWYQSESDTNIPSVDTGFFFVRLPGTFGIVKKKVFGETQGLEPTKKRTENPARLFTVLVFSV